MTTADHLDGLTRTDRRVSLGWRLLVAVLALQFVQGILGAFYTPLLAPIARNVGMRDADWNLFDSGTAAVAALALPVLTRLGDRFGHRRLIIITVILAATSTWLAVVATNFVTLFISFAVLGLTVVWVPFSMALARIRLTAAEAELRLSRLSASIVAVFMVGSVLATAAGGQLFTMTGAWDALQRGLDAGIASGDIPEFREGLLLVLAIPAVFTTLVIPLTLLLPKDRERQAEHGAFVGMLAFGAVMLGVVLGFGLVKLGGDVEWTGWLVVAASVTATIVLLRWQVRSSTPAIDVLALRGRRSGPYFAALALFTISHSAASVPLVTFVSTDRESTGYGMSATPADVSLLMLSMILVIIVVAVMFGRIRSAQVRLCAMRLAPLLIVAEYAWFTSFHDVLWQGIVAAVLGGLGAGVLNVGLTAAIAAGAPKDRTASHLGLSNVVSIAGGTIGSAVFALALHDTPDASETAAPLSGYITVWLIAIGCAVATSAILCFAREPLPRSGASNPSPARLSIPINESES